MAGTLARENAMRNPKRTASTAAALMIGVGLVGFITIAASSTKASVNASVDRDFNGDFVIQTKSFGDAGLSPRMSKDIAALPEVGEVSATRWIGVGVDGSEASLTAVDPTTFGQVADVGVTQGSLTELAGETIAVVDTVAEEQGWGLGDAVPVQFSSGEQPLRIAAIFTKGDVMGRFLVGMQTFEENSDDRVDSLVFVTKAPGVTEATAQAAIERVTTAYPNAETQSRSQYKESVAGEIDSMLNLIYVLLALAVVIALLGITNTLALSVVERTRELGLLRAVGMTRRQLRSTVRWESVIVALLGTGLGLTVGLFFGWAMVQALADEGITELDVPVTRLAIVTLVAALAGVLAAVLPARRAARLDVLKAIATT
jgi:putative ABC transport system permease protein